MPAPRMFNLDQPFVYKSAKAAMTYAEGANFTIKHDSNGQVLAKRGDIKGTYRLFESDDGSCKWERM
jgi:hypothetical protein